MPNKLDKTDQELLLTIARQSLEKAVVFEPLQKMNLIGATLRAKWSAAIAKPVFF